jgi:acyl-CoA thioesterase-1
MTAYKEQKRSTVRRFDRSDVRNVQPNCRTAELPNVFRSKGRPPARHRPGWVFLVAALLLVAVSLGWYLARQRGPDLSRVANLDAPGEVVAFFGDSITQGYGVRPEEGFPIQVAGDLGLALVNAGVAGDTTAAGLARIERDVLAHRPRLTLVEFGGNDFLRRVPLDETLKNLDAMVRTLHDQGMMVMILEVNVGLMGDPYLKGYRAVGERYGAVMVEDILGGIMGNPDLKVDSIHPNARGHRLIAERVAKVLRPLLREADRRRGSVGRQSLDFPLPAVGRVAKLYAR